MEHASVTISKTFGRNNAGKRGAEGFRADASQPSCDWQGFTE